MELDNRINTISDLSRIEAADGSDIMCRLFNSMYDGMGLFELCGEKVRALYLNERYFEVVGYTKEQYRPYLDNITVTMFADDEKRFLDHAKSNADSEHDSCFEVRGYRADGSVCWFSIRTRTVNYVKCDNPAYLAAVSDCTAAKNMEISLKLNMERYRILEEIGATYLFEYNPALDEMVFLPGRNKAGHRFTSYSRQLRRSTSIHPDDTAYFYTVLLTASRRECKGTIYARGSDNKGGWVMCCLSYSSITGDGDDIIRVLGRADITEKADISYPGETGNTIMQKAAAAAISEIESRLKALPASSVLIMADIDGMGGYNKELGYDRGSAALYAFEKAARDIFREGIVFRYMEDIFVIYAENMTESEMYYLIDKLQTGAENILPEVKDSTLRFSAGIAEAGRSARPEEAVSFRDMLITAAHALYKAKKDGSGSLETENVIYR